MFLEAFVFSFQSHLYFFDQFLIVADFHVNNFLNILKIEDYLHLK